MAHQIAKNKNDEWMTAWSGKTPWHGLGQNFGSELMTGTEAIEAARLNWLVEKIPLQVYDEENKRHVVVPDTFGVFRRDLDGDLVSLTKGGKTVGRVWKPFQNWEAFQFLDELTNCQEAKIEVCGALGNGERVWVLAKIPYQIKLMGKDKIDCYILISNTHDGSGAVKFMLTPIRVVCNNTLTLALKQSGGQGHSVRHTGKVHSQVDNVRKVLGLMVDEFDEWGNDAESTLSIKMKKSEMREYFANALGVERKEQADGSFQFATKGFNKILECEKLLEKKTNRVGKMAGTLWAAYNALTEYLDHVESVPKAVRDGKANADDAKMQAVQLKKQESALFGQGARQKRKGWELAIDMVANA